jgi:O-antigen ligase
MTFMPKHVLGLLVGRTTYVLWQVQDANIGRILSANCLGRSALPFVARIYDMILLLGFSLIAAMIWVAAFTYRTPLWVLGFGVFASGNCLGHAFFHLNVGPIPLTIDRVVLAAWLAQFVLFWRAGLIQPKRLTRTDGLLLAFLAYLGTNVALSDWQANQKAPLSYLLFFYCQPALIYFLISQIKISAKQFQCLLLGCAVVGSYLALTAVSESRGWWGLVFPKYIVDPTNIEFLGRGRGPFLNPVSNGICMVLCLVGMLLLWPHASGWRISQWLLKVSLPPKANSPRCESMSESDPSKLVRVVPAGLILARAALAIIGVILLVGAYCTLTRSVWMACAFSVGGVIWLAASQRQRGLLIAASAVMMIAGYVALDQIQQFKRDKHVTQTQMAESATLRPMLAAVAYEMFWDHPLGGVGLAQYKLHSQPYHFNDEWGMPLRRVSVYIQHNWFLSLLAETGLIGLALMLTLLGAWIRQAWQLWQSRELPLHARQAGLLALTVISSMAINGLFHDTSVIPMGMTMLSFATGLSQGMRRHFASQAVSKTDQEVMHGNGVFSEQPLSPSLA